MSTSPLKSTARLWKQAKRPSEKYRDRKRVRLPDGSPVDLAGYGRTRNEATADLYAKVEATLARAASLERPTVTQVFAKYVRDKQRLKGRKYGTIHGNIDLFKRHVKPHVGDKVLIDVTLDELTALQARLTVKGRWRTAELLTVLVKSMWAYYAKQNRQAMQQGRFYDVAMDLEQVQRPKAAKARKNVGWSADDLMVFFEAAKARYDKNPGDLWYPVFHVAIAAGLRRGELLGLKRSDLVKTKDGYVLTITGQQTYYGGKHRKESTKSPAGERHVPIGPETVEVLKAHMRRIDKLARAARKLGAWKNNDLMFPSSAGTPIEPGQLYRARDNVLKALAAEGKMLDRTTLHSLRGIYSTYITRKLVKEGRYSPNLAMKLLGHTRAKQAIETYNQVIGEDLALAVLEPSSDIALDIPAKEKDAVPEETAS